MLGKLGLMCSGETRYDQEHHEKESFFHLAEFYVACCVIFLCRKTFKQPFTDVLQNGVLKNFATFTGKYMCWSFFLIKLQA